MEDVPLRMPHWAFEQVKQEVDIIVPDYLTILQETEHEFSLEKWVLTGLQHGFSPRQHRPAVCSSASGVQPSCPPYWMMFSSPQQSRLASRHNSDFWEPNPRQRSHSLNPAVLRAKFVISDSEDDEERSAAKAQTPSPVNTGSDGGRPAALCQRVQRKTQKAFVPDLLNPPACLSSLPHQRRKNLRQCSLSALETNNQDDGDASSRGPNPSPHRTPQATASSVQTGPGFTYQKKTHMSLLTDSGSAPSRPLPSPSAGSDSSAELLSALSPEERELLGAVTARGYSLRTAIIALQKTGRQTPDQASDPHSSHHQNNTTFSSQQLSSTLICCSNLSSSSSLSPVCSSNHKSQNIRPLFSSSHTHTHTHTQIVSLPDLRLELHRS
ncbi:uncharacterized protein ubap1lb isoform X1 [Genypterus blacodes]|uniref:uncharacterized protein ubap1lb isoform X1 n=1 Tax=Genypterus blacodes TaxID=154954 RepID=UPI003F777EAC